MRWQRSRGTLGLPRPLSTVVVRSDHLQHPGNRSEEWRKDLHGRRQTAGRCKVCGSDLGERKAALLWKGGNPFCGREKEERERGLRECGIGSHKVKASLTTAWGDGGTEWHICFANSEWKDSSSEVLEVHDFHPSGAAGSSPGE